MAVNQDVGSALPDSGAVAPMVPTSGVQPSGQKINPVTLISFAVTGTGGAVIASESTHKDKSPFAAK